MESNEVIYPLRLSPTKLQAWFEAGCPAKFKYEQIWESIEGNKFLEVGTEVHTIMEKGVGDHIISEWEETPKFAMKLQDLLDALDLEILFTEKKIEWEIRPGVIWAEKIDAIGRFRRNGELVVIDYKTNWGKGWKPIAPLIVPASLIFQSPSYLMTPPGWDGDWPKRLIYIVAPLWSPGEYHIVTHSEEAEQNLLEAIDVAAASIRVAEKQNYPKVRGKLCLDCRVREICYELPAWESNFKAKGHHG